MDLRTFYKWTRKMTIEEKMELIYKNAWQMSCDAFDAGWYDAVHNKDSYDYNQNERYAMKARIRYLCWQIIQDIKEGE